MKKIKLVISVALFSLITFASCGGDSNSNTNNSVTQNSNDKDKFIGTFTWNGGCPRGCWADYIFKQDGTVQIKEENANEKFESTKNWTLDEKSKVLDISGLKFQYKFSNDTLILTNSDINDRMDLIRQK